MTLDGKARYELNDDHNHLIDIKTGNIINLLMKLKKFKKLLKNMDINY